MELKANVPCSRRTKQSGPLGELFDHGVDALNTSLEVLIFAASQNMGQGWKTVATLCTGMSRFLYSQQPLNMLIAIQPS